MHIQIADWIRQVFRAGFSLDRERLNEMEASFGITDPAELFADPLSSEAASFLDLLFFPDRAVRQAYEARWGDQTCTGETVRAVLDVLGHPPAVAFLHIEGRTHPVALNASEDVVAGFVHRLNIDWHPPDALHGVLRSRLETPHRSMVGAALRQTRLDWHENQVAMLDLFLSRFGPLSEDFETSLTFLLSNLYTLDPAADLFGFWVARKFFYFQSLCNAERFEQRRQAVNMETLILQGERAAHGSIQQWREWMRQVDRICVVLFGRTEFFQQPLAEHAGFDKADLDGIIDFLS